MSDQANEKPLVEQTQASSEKTLAEQAPSSHECRSCGYVYDPAKGDSQSKIPSDTLFENYPVPGVAQYAEFPEVSLSILAR